MLWWRPELWKGTTHPFATFCTKRTICQLLWSDSQGVGVYYSICSIWSIIWKVSTVTFFKFIRVGIWCKCGGCLQETLHQHGLNQSGGTRREHWAVRHGSLRSTTWSLMGEDFEQWDPPTKDKATQIDVDDQVHPKLISISESLSRTEKQDLISLIKEYIDVFAWSYEDMPGLDPQVAITSTLSQRLNRSNNSSDAFDWTLWRQLKLRSKNLSNVASFKRNNTQTGLLTLCLF